MAPYPGTATTYDPARAALPQSAINADARAPMAFINATTTTRVGEIGAVLQTATVLPGGVAGGPLETNDTGMAAVV